MAMVKSSNNHEGDSKKHKKYILRRRKTVILDIFGKPFPRSLCLFSLQPPSADHMTRREKCIRNALVAMRVVIQLWGHLIFFTSLNFYTFNVRETAVLYIHYTIAWCGHNACSLCTSTCMSGVRLDISTRNYIVI